MATSDFRFRVSKAVGSPSVQGAASMETLANHTENPHPHPQYMRKSYVGMEVGLTEHLASRLHHARCYALRDELTTTKLEYERYKWQSLAHDASNFMAESGVKAHVITAYVLNQILEDVGLDGSAEALTYSNLINSYDTKVSDASRYAPTWDMFLKLKNSIALWLVSGKPSDYVLKADWLTWVKYMYGAIDPASEDHPLRPGLKVALYAMDYCYDVFTRPNTHATDEVGYAGLSSLTFVPSLALDRFDNAVYYLKPTADVTPNPNKEYYYVSSGVTYQFTGSTFSSGTTYYEKVYKHLSKVQGDCVTNGCGILEKNCNEKSPEFFDWCNGLKWNLYAGICGEGDTNPYSIKMMVWEGRIKLNVGQTIKFSGVADDYAIVVIGNTVITKTSATKYWHVYGDHHTEETYEDCTKYSYTAASSGLFKFMIAVVNKEHTGSRVPCEAAAPAYAVPFRMSLDNGVTYTPITNEILDSPIFYLPENSEKDYREAGDQRDEYNYKPERVPGLLIKMWKAPEVSQSAAIDTTTYTISTAQVNNLKRISWMSDAYAGDSTPGGNARSWTPYIGPVITNGCSMLAKCCKKDDQVFFDWYNGLNWPYYAGDSEDSIKFPWARRSLGWFGTIYLRKGEIVKFKGRVEDQYWIKIDDTWVVDGVTASSAAWETDTEYSYSSTYTGYHPFKLLTCNKTFVGPKRNEANDNHLRMSINGATYVEITNESFNTPRFFLPDDCDHEKFWNEGIISRARYSSAGMIVPMSSASSKRLSHSLEELAKDYGPFTMNSRKYHAWQLIVGKTYNSSTDEFIDDPNWKPGCDVGYVSIDVGFRDSVWATFDNYMFLWTPDDTSPCQVPANSSGVESRYYGVRMCVQHGISDSVDWDKGRSVHQQTLVIPKGSIITFIVGGNTHDENATISCCHSTITYFWNPKL